MNFENKETETAQILRLDMHVDEGAESHGHVESEIAKWQKEIDQTEQQWLKKLQRVGSADLTATAAGKLQENGSLQSETTGKKLQENGSLQSETTRKFQYGGSAESATTEKLQQNGSLQHSATTGKPPSAHHRMRQIVSDVHDGGSCEQEGKSFKKNVQAPKSKVIEVGIWSSSGCVTPSECSTVSSDLDFDADMPIMLPSVKELTKHFSGSTSDSDCSITKPLPEPRRSKAMEVTKEVVIISREKQQQQQQQQQAMREVHSLTARSISKEFRDGLRRNLPSHLDRNLHTTANSTISNGTRNLFHVTTDLPVTTENGDNKVPPANGIRELEGMMSVSAGQRDSGLTEPKGSRLKNVTDGAQHNLYVRGEGSIPGYTSDESGTQSLSPPLGRRVKLQSSIEFWERLQHSRK